jgi:Protein of unknown function (DUF3574)
MAADSTICGNAQEQRQVVQLLFGRGAGNEAGVTDADWSDFVSRELTPRFPDGFTVLDSAGQWRNPQRGIIIREIGKVVEIVLPGNHDDASKVDAVIDAYKLQFRQQSVGLIVEPACVRF